MEETVITFGRFRNKTFQHVYMSDRGYCKDLVRMPRKSGHGGNSEKFIEFLKGKPDVNDPENSVNVVGRSRNESELDGDSSFRQREQWFKPDNQDLINEIYCGKFVNAFNNHHKSEMSRILGLCGSEIESKTVHANSSIDYNNIIKVFGIFFKHFVFKIIHNLKNAEVTFRIKKVNYFPFSLNFDYSEYTEELVIFQYLDESLIEDVKKFLTENYVLVENYKKEIKHLLRLISVTESVQDEEIKKLIDEKCLIENREEYVEILKKYMIFYFSYLEIFRRDEAYLPKNNICLTCTTLPKGYDTDNVLKAILSYRKYAHYKGDIFEILEDIMNFCKLIGTINFKFDYVNECKPQEVDVKYLEIWKRYIENIPNIKTAILKPFSRIKFSGNLLDQRNRNEISYFYQTVEEQLSTLMCSEGAAKSIVIDSIDECCIVAKPDILIGNQLIHICYSSQQKNQFENFYELIFCSSQFESIDQIVIYNAFTGEESYMVNIPDKEKIKKFVRKYKDPKAFEEFLESVLNF